MLVQHYQQNVICQASPFLIIELLFLIFKIPHSKQHLHLLLDVCKIDLGNVAVFTFPFNRQPFHSWRTPRHSVSDVGLPVAALTVSTQKWND